MNELFFSLPLPAALVFLKNEIFFLLFTAHISSIISLLINRKKKKKKIEQIFIKKKHRNAMEGKSKYSAMSHGVQEATKNKVK